MQVITADEAARLVQPGWTVACAGFVGAGHADASWPPASRAI
jgi:propionate CoA-transferase